MARRNSNSEINDNGIDTSIPDTPVYASNTKLILDKPTTPAGQATGVIPLVAADTDFLNKKWRPMMAWVYMAICICDFILFPVMWSVLQAAQGGMIDTQWAPITLEGGGLIHVAMGAVLGIAAYGRTQEKLNDKM
jgi:hypothetical protein